MPQHQVITRWTKEEASEEELQLSFDDGVSLTARSTSDAPVQTLFEPEQALVAAISNCHMLSFLAEAAKAGLTVSSYEDIADGFLAKNDAGRIFVAKAVVTVGVKHRVPGIELIRAGSHKLHLI